MDEGTAQVKELQRYVDLVSKATVAPEASEIHARLELIPQDALKHYWDDLRNRLMLRAARAIPYYRTPDQKAAFHEAAIRLAQPEVAGQGRGEALRAHLCQVLLEQIRSDQETHAEFLAKPWFVRMHAYWAIAFIAAVWLSIPLLIINYKQTHLVMSLVWGAFLLTGIVIRVWLKWSRRARR